ncbi:MAG TPA: rhomboid family intramembrane serine protease [Bacteroidetes bacterium]|nr:rhomboid family intramembrane serine protease [Bacteroidota bacterium]
MNNTFQRVRFGPSSSMTPVVKYLIITNVGIFLLQHIIGLSMIRIFGLTPARLLYDFAIWQPFTYMFLHGQGSILHILINMFVLWMFGTEIEREWGSKAFLKYYLVCGVGAGFIQVFVNAVLFSGNMEIPVVGASGAIYGLILAYALMFPNRELTLLLFFVLPVSIKAKYFAMLFAAISLFSGLMQPGSNVAHFAHLGGMLVGLVYLKLDWRLSFISDYFAQRRETREIIQHAKRRQQQLQLRENVDAILDKINDVGFENLTDEEKELLRRASKDLKEEES